MYATTTTTRFHATTTASASATGIERGADRSRLGLLRTQCGDVTQKRAAVEILVQMLLAALTHVEATRIEEDSADGKDRSAPS